MIVWSSFVGHPPHSLGLHTTDPNFEWWTSSAAAQPLFALSPFEGLAVSRMATFANDSTSKNAFAAEAHFLRQTSPLVNSGTVSCMGLASTSIQYHSPLGTSSGFEEAMDLPHRAAPEK